MEVPPSSILLPLKPEATSCFPPDDSCGFRLQAEDTTRVAIEVRRATAADAPAVAAILAEVDAWVAQLGTPMWERGEVDRDRVVAEVAGGLFALAWCGGEAAGTVKFQ